MDIILDSLSNAGMSPALIMSVVFPEMIRYSMFRDFFETKAIELLYVNDGKESADFSIGCFQMKPSFIEMLETEIEQNIILRKKFTGLYTYSSDLRSVNEIRYQRVQRLKSIEWQLYYLKAFCILISMQFDEFQIDNENKLPYMSLVYNYGLNTDINQISGYLKKKTFPYGPGHHNPFSYAEVSQYFFDHEAKIIFKP